MYTVAGPDPINPRGAGQIPNLNKCNSSETRGVERVELGERR